MNGITIDRLTLEGPGLSATGARSLAMAVAEQLSATGLQDWPREVPTLRVDLSAGVGTNADAEPGRLATEIISEMLRQLRQSS
jgi:hypothetical protein